MTYLTQGISWKSDYVVVLDEESGSMNLDSWITLNNNSGTAYTFFTADNSKLAADLVKVLSEAKQEVNPKLHELAASSRGFQARKYRCTA